MGNCMRSEEVQLLDRHRTAVMSWHCSGERRWIYLHILGLTVTFSPLGLVQLWWQTDYDVRRRTSENGGKGGIFIAQKDFVDSGNR